LVQLAIFIILKNGIQFGNDLSITERRINSPLY